MFMGLFLDFPSASKTGVSKEYKAWGYILLIWDEDLTIYLKLDMDIFLNMGKLFFAAI